ncbi:DUF6421 family protein [Streptomyces sp. NPDC049915]|uniref:DUF6421 family protein n=1 Tax=Streptomyces sp. NPDC049915 TaxID=3155510 RepID=UPI0034152893
MTSTVPTGPGLGSTGTAQVPALATAEPWLSLKHSVGELRAFQCADGSVDFEGRPDRERIGRLLDDAVAAVQDLAGLLPHDALYLHAVAKDLRRWADDGFGVPDFLDSLAAFRPAAQRTDGLPHVVVFATRLMNGDPGSFLEALAVRVVWPQWLADVERAGYDNPLVVPLAFEDFTDGFDSHTAVLFPESVSVRSAPPSYDWGALFCDREAARFATVVSAAAKTLRLELPQDARELLTDHERCMHAFALWDTLHDRSHNKGSLPFDPFLVRQRCPQWIYALEELRCELRAHRDARHLERDGVPQARDAQFALVLDRLLRFPVTGERDGNYDALCGQLLFAYLHRHQAVDWWDNVLTINWERVPTVLDMLLGELESLYRSGVNRPKVVHWAAAYDLVCTYLSPHPASAWAQGGRALDLTEPPRNLVDDVLPDEFPLGLFYAMLARRLRTVVASVKGITTPLETARG